MSLPFVFCFGLGCFNNKCTTLCTFVSLLWKTTWKTMLPVYQNIVNNVSRSKEFLDVKFPQPRLSSFLLLFVAEKTLQGDKVHFIS